MTTADNQDTPAAGHARASEDHTIDLDYPPENLSLWDITELQPPCDDILGEGPDTVLMPEADLDTDTWLRTVRAKVKEHLHDRTGHVQEPHHMAQEPSPPETTACERMEATWYIDDVVAGPGGVMTCEVGVITGELTVRTYLDYDGHNAHVTVQYTGAEEWYELQGSPVALPADGLATVHSTVVEAIRAGGPACAPGPGRT
ncbi:hypothetical protein [Streptomyces alanosinicus]|uniref:Uncharacterized protein n=1 Tax=Streptomyces alanosinicus TaxID=68171 RepID=A0A919D5Y6_9ACTN|nr:hypothetical protein [Streptomyces alanosinicus]GHE11013.1 hypothetical protein GCM10010339_69120 [Streptomyces alanosinicus]